MKELLQHSMDKCADLAIFFTITDLEYISHNKTQNSRLLHKWVIEEINSSD